MEDYKEKYEQALERAKVINPGTADYEVAVKIFPELKESEDERIKKFISHELACLRAADEKGSDRYKELTDAIAWLEKQKEQKSVNTIVEDLPKGEDYGIDSLWHAIQILERTLGEVEGYQSDDGILEHKCAIEAIKRLYKQKSTEWSENDELNFNQAIYVYHQHGYLGVETWLKSLKERIKV